jgi:hypothetical protein
MNKNQFQLLLGVLAIVVVGLIAYVIYDQTRPKGIEIRLDDSGISVQEN